MPTKLRDGVVGERRHPRQVSISFLTEWVGFRCKAVSPPRVWGWIALPKMKLLPALVNPHLDPPVEG
jgi:hypothetical protein